MTISTKRLVVSKFDQWFSLYVRSHPFATYIAYLLLLGGNVLSVVPIKITYSGDNSPIVDASLITIDSK
jgi:hypothetical protein